MKVTHAGRQITVNVTADGDGVVSHAGSALLAQVADITGLTEALSTAFRVINRIASTPGLLDAVRDAHAVARARVWELAGAPDRVTIDLDATLITAHSEKDRAAGTFKGGYGFAPMLAYGDETGEALAGELRPGNAGSNNVIDQILVAERAVAQIPAAYRDTIEIALRVDSAGACHDLLDWARERQILFSVGYDLTETIRAVILEIPYTDWECALDQEGGERPNGEIAEITEHLDLSTWPAGARVIVRRERAHPGAQLTFTDTDGHRFQTILTDHTGPIAPIERDHRVRARVEDQIRNDKNTGLRNLPFREFEHNQVRLQIVRLAHDLIAWTQRLLLTGELASCEPKDCATDSCTSQVGSASTRGPPRCDSPCHGRGRPHSPTRSTASASSRCSPDLRAGHHHEHHTHAGASAGGRSLPTDAPQAATTRDPPRARRHARRARPHWPSNERCHPAPHKSVTTHGLMHNPG